jgi:acetoin utilization protein AcuB
MTRDVVVVGPQFPLQAAFSLMQERRIRHLPVVHRGHLLGILSDRDVLLRSTVDADGTIATPRDPVALAMTPAPLTCTPDTQVPQLAKMMVEKKIDAVPVMGKGGSLVGLVTSSDLLLLLFDKTAIRALPFDFRVYEGERLVAEA